MTSANSANPFQLDTAAALTYLGDDDPSLDRFMSVEPVLCPLDPQQNNGYAYGWN